MLGEAIWLGKPALALPEPGVLEQAFNARALVTQDRHAPGESGVLARSASGALETLKWSRVVNLARALDEIG